MDRPSTWMQPIARTVALVAGFALVLQLALIVGQFAGRGEGVGAALWRFFGFFTILSNLFVCIVAAAMGLRAGSPLARPWVRLSALVAILLVGITYSIALRHVWEPTGWQAVADHLLHDAVPPLFLLAWLASGHGTLRWGQVWRALLFPLAYLAYAVARGAYDGWYAYYFLDPGKAGWGGFAAAAGGITVAVALGAAILVAVDRWLGSGRARRR